MGHVVSTRCLDKARDAAKSGPLGKERNAVEVPCGRNPPGSPSRAQMTLSARPFLPGADDLKPGGERAVRRQGWQAPLLHGADVAAGFEQVGGEGMTPMPISALAPLCRWPGNAAQHGLVGRQRVYWRISGGAAFGIIPDITEP